MRQRITYLLPVGSDNNPADIKVSDVSLTHPHQNAVEERRITLGLSDLPKEVGNVASLS